MTSQMAPRSAGTKCVRVGLCAVAHPLNRWLCAGLIVYNIKYICIYITFYIKTIDITFSYFKILKTNSSSFKTVMCHVQLFYYVIL